MRINNFALSFLDRKQYVGLMKSQTQEADANILDCFGRRCGSVHYAWAILPTQGVLCQNLSHCLFSPFTKKYWDLKGAVEAESPSKSKENRTSVLKKNSSFVPNQHQIIFNKLILLINVNLLQCSLKTHTHESKYALLWPTAWVFFFSARDINVTICLFEEKLFFSLRFICCPAC